MVAIVTLDIFSGRPNPGWELTQHQIAALRDELSRERDGTLLKPTTALSRLGYIGFHVESSREDLPQHLSVGGGVIELARHAPSLFDPERRIEQFLLETATGAISSELQDRVARAFRSELSAESLNGRIMAAPPYNPGKWNTDPIVQRNNNCYNYGCDKVLRGFAQPGRGSGQMFSVFSCGDVGNASTRDGLRSVAGVNGNPPANCHYVALVIDPIGPDLDYHWYRFDSNGRWSHKRGITAATDKDNSNQVILNPETADRGEYTGFCGYYEVNATTVRLA